MEDVAVHQPVNLSAVFFAIRELGQGNRQFNTTC
jgi:hypothetical protein